MLKGTPSHLANATGSSQGSCLCFKVEVKGTKRSVHMSEVWGRDDTPSPDLPALCQQVWLDPDMCSLCRAGAGTRVIQPQTSE